MDNTVGIDLKYGTRVLTPDGEGDAIAVDPGKGEYLVSFSRDDFTPAAWVRMSPANGPSVFRMYPKDQLSTVATRDKLGAGKAKKNA